MIHFDATEDDTNLIRAIVERAIVLARELELQAADDVDPLSLTMDITACHLNGTALDLADLLAADDGNFGHDVFGIRCFMDRDSGQLTGGFRPRYAVNQNK